MDLKQFRTKVTQLATDDKQPSDEEFHKLIVGWLNEVTVAKVKAAMGEVTSQLKGGLHKAMDYLHEHHNK